MNESERQKIERQFAREAKVIYGIDLPNRVIVRFLAWAEAKSHLTLQPEPNEKCGLGTPPAPEPPTQPGGPV